MYLTGGGDLSGYDFAIFILTVQLFALEMITLKDKW